MDVEAQDWLEAAPAPKRDMYLGSIASLTCIRASSTQATTGLHATAPRPPIQQHAHSSLAAHAVQAPAVIYSEDGIFDESFAQALNSSVKPPAAVISASRFGQLHQEPSLLDGHNDYGERAPLLKNKGSTQSLPSASASTFTCPLLKPRAKSKPSLSICLWHEISHNSEYTRPVAEILREVLEAYPATLTDGEVDTLVGHNAVPELGYARGYWRKKWRWWKNSMRAR